MIKALPCNVCGSELIDVDDGYAWCRECSDLFYSPEIGKPGNTPDQAIEEWNAYVFKHSIIHEEHQVRFRNCIAAGKRYMGEDEPRFRADDLLNSVQKNMRVIATNSKYVEGVKLRFRAVAFMEAGRYETSIKTAIEAIAMTDDESEKFCLRNVKRSAEITQSNLRSDNES